MGSVTQFAFGAAVGAALFIGVTTAQRLFLVTPAISRTEHEERNSSEDASSRQEQLHSLQSAATPVRHASEISESGGAAAENVVESEAKEGQHFLSLLFNIAEDQARKEGYIHRGITCNSCQTSPICGIRYKCANCVDYDVCERCEVRDDHNKTHLFIKIRIPMPPLTNPRAPCLKPLYPGYYAFSNFTNHKNYNFLNCDWFKKLLFPTNSLAKLLSDSFLSDSSTNQSNSKL